MSAVEASPALLWQLVRKSNSFMSRNLNGLIFSREAGNLASKHSYKYSGLANRADTVGVAEQDGAVAISVSSKKTPGKLATTLVKKNTRRTIVAAGAVAGTKRPDLKHAAKARAAAVAKALRKRKATAN